MNKKIFITEGTEKLVGDSFQEVDVAEANRLVQEGKAVEANMNEMDDYAKRIDHAVATFRKAYDEMVNSNDPKYKVEGAIEYFTDQMKEELASDVEEINAEYQAVLEGAKQQGREEKANQRRFVTDDDRKNADYLISELVTDLKVGNPEDALKRLEEDIPHMKKGRKLATSFEIHRLADAIKGHPEETNLKRRIQSLNSQLKDVGDNVDLTNRMFNAMPNNADQAYRRLKITHPSFKTKK